jgi:hypothetical protein
MNQKTQLTSKSDHKIESFPIHKITGWIDSHAEPEPNPKRFA